MRTLDFLDQTSREGAGNADEDFLETPLPVTDGTPEEVCTLLVRNVPKGYNQESLQQEWAAFPLNLLHVPFSRRHQTNRGFAFVGFSDPSDAAFFQRRVQGTCLKGSEPLEVRPAHIQGFEQTLKNFSSNFLHLPMVLEGGVQLDTRMVLQHLQETERPVDLKLLARQFQQSPSPGSSATENHSHLPSSHSPKLD